MKTLTLLRHAKSSWAEAGVADFDRALNERGRAAATRLGQEMRHLGLEFDAVFASPARRVAETVALVEQAYGKRLPIQIKPQIYEASVESLLGLIRTAAATVGSLLVVGHNPGLQQLALALTKAGETTLREGLADNLPTAALVEIRLPIAPWTEAGDAGGTLHRFVRPRDLDF